MKRSIMLDLETLDTAPTAVVIAIGAVEFDPMGSRMGEQKYWAVNINDWTDQQKHGRTIKGETVAWWLGGSPNTSPDQAARDALFGWDAVPIRQALTEFEEMVGDGPAEVWGNGADFDNIILGSLYEAYGLRKPWSYGRNRCFRTMKNLPMTKEFIKPARIGTDHNALDDAINQARHLQAIFRNIRP